MTQEQWLAQYIASCFAGVTLGNGIDLYAAQSMDDHGNPDEDHLSLSAERHDWRRVPSDDLFPRFWAVTFLDALGFRFYTPAIMTALLQPDDPGECLSSWFLANLSITQQGTIKEVPFNTLFTARHKAALMRFLKYAIYNRSRRFDTDVAIHRMNEIQARS
ncbi:MAG: DUF6714 family protein [Planctomycetota bacterium]